MVVGELVEVGLAPGLDAVESDERRHRIHGKLPCVLKDLLKRRDGERVRPPPFRVTGEISALLHNGNGLQRPGIDLGTVRSTTRFISCLRTSAG